MKNPDTDPTPRVLVVDDEPDLRNLYELSLVREGYQILSAGTLAEARALMAGQSFDVLITDMNLPDGQGLELLHDIARAAARAQHRHYRLRLGGKRRGFAQKRRV